MSPTAHPRLLVPPTAARLFSAAALLLSAGCTVAAQNPPATASVASDSRAARWLDDCRHSRNDDQERFCESREYTVAATQSLSVDGRQNGSVVLHAWDQNSIKVVAVVQAWADDEKEAADIAHRVEVRTDHGEIAAEGPSQRRHESWAVSYEVWAPRHTNLTIDAYNGSVTAEGFDSRTSIETMNGSLTLTDVAGDVRATTTNGSVRADLHGAKWNGEGLEVRTTNGSVRVSLPENYAADLEVGTTNGSLNIDFPITVRGSVTRHIETQLGGGGPHVRFTTVNGSVNIRRS